MMHHSVSVCICFVGLWLTVSPFAFAEGTTVRRPQPPAGAGAQRVVVPGFEGFGVRTMAGRGGKVVRVKTLAADGPGSLQEALDTPGQRTVVFDVGGVIELSRHLEINEPFVTVAGQTAPSPGITLTGCGLHIRTSHVLVQHIRVRVGDGPTEIPPDGRDGIVITGDPDGTRDVGHIVIDHCSAAWGIDECASIWHPGVHDVTFRHCIFAEGLSNSLHHKGEHSKGLLIGDHARRIAVIGCLFAHNTNRNPLVKNDVTAVVVNNLIYNPHNGAIHTGGGVQSGPSALTAIGNVLVPGVDTLPRLAVVSIPHTGDRGTKIHVHDNSGPREWPTFAAFPAGFDPLVADPPKPLPELTILPAARVHDWVLAHAGARPADRDAVDARIIDDVRRRSGNIIDSPRQVGGLPVTKPVSRIAEPPPDPHADHDGDGYTNLDAWLYAQAHAVERTSSPAPSPRPLISAPSTAPDTAHGPVAGSENQTECH